MTLREALEGGHPLGKDQRAALEFAWIRPRSAGLARVAEREVPSSRVERVEPGQTLLVSVTRDGRGELWRLSHRATRPVDALPWGFEADTALVNARRIVHGVLPLLATELEEPEGSWYPEAVHSPEDSPHLDGPSYGASMLLAVASLRLGKVVPIDVVASAAVDADGRLVEVDEIDAKIETVLDTALGIRRFIVAGQQGIGEAARARARAGNLRIVEVATAEDLVAEVFARSIQAAARRAFSDPGECLERAERLHGFALRTRPLLSWASVRRTAERLQEALEKQGNGPKVRRARAQAAFAAAVAARHEGDPLELPWPARSEILGMGRPVALRHLAHVLQSRTDAGDPRLAAQVARVRTLARTGKRGSEEDWILLGAIGRAWARLREYEKAARVLRAVVESWLEYDPRGASIPLCELLRVTGILGDAAGLDELEREAIPRVLCAGRGTRAELEDDQAFLRLARGRARLCLVRHAGALDDLSDEPFWSRARLHVRTSRLRWLARAHDSRGQAREASRCRARLAALAKERGSGGDQVLLAELDRLLQHGGGARAISGVTRKLCVRHRPDCALLAARVGAGELPRVLADEFPY